MSNPNLRFRAPAGHNGISWNGQWYEVIDGCVDMPSAAYAEVTRPIHGFVLERDARVLPAPVKGRRAA